MGDFGGPPPDVEGMSTLKVDNLTYSTTPDMLRKVFEKYGDIGDVYIPRDYRTKGSRGFAFVRFYDHADAEDAMDTMDGTMLDGRPLRVQVARYGRPGARGRNKTGRRGRSRSRSQSRSKSRDRRRRRSRSQDRRSRDRRDRRDRSRSRSRNRRDRNRDDRSRSRSDSKSNKSRSRSRSRDEATSKSPFNYP